MPNVLNPVRSKDERSVMFYCEGCKMAHRVIVKGGKPIWEWNDDLEKPTISPYIRVQWEDGEDYIKKVCHSYVKDGMIQYLGDCTHELAGKTVPLKPWKEIYPNYNV